MILPEWLRQVLRLANADQCDRQPAELAQLLDQRQEVLPFVIGAGGFADWPETQTALTRAASNVPGSAARSRVVTADATDWAYGPDREELIVRMHALIVSAGPRGLMPNDTADPDVDDLAGMVHALRRKQGLGGPSSFIGGVFAGDMSSEGMAQGANAGRPNPAIANLFRLLDEQPVWWRLMSTRWRRASLLRLAEKRGMFDGKAYLSRHPDVAAAGMNPLHHYMVYGYNEGRRI